VSVLPKERHQRPQRLQRPQAKSKVPPMAVVTTAAAAAAAIYSLLVTYDVRA